MCSQAPTLGLIILTYGKNNHKTKRAGTGRLVVGIHPLDCKCILFIICENADALVDYLYGGGGGGGEEGTGVKRTSHYY